MFQLRKGGRVGYEDLMRELEIIERQVLQHDGSLAMNLMVLETKIRERFQMLETGQAAPEDDDFPANVDALTMADIRALIPQDLPPMPEFKEIEAALPPQKKTMETICIAAGLAVATALGVFGLASVLQMALSWLA